MGQTGPDQAKRGNEAGEFLNEEICTTITSSYHAANPPAGLFKR